MALRSFSPLAFFALIGLWACEAATPVAPPATPSGPSGAALDELRCTVSVAAGTLVCERPGGGARGDLILGGQGVRVRLTSSNVVIDPATSTLSADVTVRNLMSQSIGTPDGTTVSGVKVFFHQLPTVTDGSGTVSVQNPDGVAPFTAANQPYFLYEEILEPERTSVGKPWKFTVPSTATAFVFSVYVAAAAPVETGVTRWIGMHGDGFMGGYSRSTAVWGSSGDRLFVVGYSPGVGGSVVYWNGHSWIELLRTENPSDRFKSVSGTSDTDVWVASVKELLHYNGNTWIRYPVQIGADSVNAVWAATPNLAFAVGSNSLVLRWNGSEWSRVSIPALNGTPEFRSIWGSSPNDVWVAGYANRMLHYNGSSWTWMANSPGFLNAVWGSSSTDVYAVGGRSIYHYDGTAWDGQDVFVANQVYSVGGSGPDDVYVVGTDRVARPVVLSCSGVGCGGGWTGLDFDPAPIAVGGSSHGHLVAVGPGVMIRKAPGSEWNPVGSRPLHDVEAISTSDAYAVGTEVLHWNGSAWSVLVPAEPARQYRAAAYDGAGTLYTVGYGGLLRMVVNGVVGAPTTISTRALNGVWAADAANVWAVGDTGTILRSSGGGTFTPVASGTTQHLYEVWGSSATNVFAVGLNGTILHYDGTAWSSMASGTTQHLWSVHGSGPHDIWAAGASGTVLHFDGSTWTTVPSGTTKTLFALWVAPNGMVYAGGDRVLMRYANGAWGTYPRQIGIVALSGLSANEVFAVKPDGVILHGQR